MPPTTKTIKHTTIVKSEKKKRNWTNTDTRVLYERLDMIYDECEKRMLRAIANENLNNKYINHAIKNFQRVSKAVNVLKKVKELKDNTEYNLFAKYGDSYKNHL